MGRLGIVPFLGPVSRLSLKVRLIINPQGEDQTSWVGSAKAAGLGRGVCTQKSARSAELTWWWEMDTGTTRRLGPPPSIPACHRLQQDISPWGQEWGCRDSTVLLCRTGVVWSLGPEWRWQQPNRSPPGRRTPPCELCTFFLCHVFWNCTIVCFVGSAFFICWAAGGSFQSGMDFFQFWEIFLNYFIELISQIISSPPFSLWFIPEISFVQMLGPLDCSLF